ncbi:hypothetical protein QUW40_07890 [Collinsella tanakaei]|uniref:hypothetical protein n=1 Tax=Collinsella tanakaei TaxID=626935 RepID=UPI0025A472B3|nr:hypothetical protein [Collinsella tanakaei]MDM8246521.1 hypothetical protein [Collinsella tanakaei]
MLEAAEDESAENAEQFDAIYQSKADQLAFIAQNNVGFEATDAKMVEYQELLGVENVLVVDQEGKVVAKALESNADFTSSRFNLLRETFRTHEPSEAVEIELPEQEWHKRYYASRIDDKTMAVVEQSPDELTELIAATGSTKSVLRNISIGQHGYVIAISAKDYLVTYHPDENLVGADAIDAGLDVAALEDGAFSNITLDGTELFCGVTRIGDTYYLCSVPEADMEQSGAVTVCVILFAFFVVIAAVTLYGIFLMRDDERRESEDDKFATLGKLRINRTIAGKALVLSIVGFLGILIVSYYMQTLFALSSQSLTNNERAEQIAQTIERSQERADELTEQYGERYLSKAQVAAYVIDRNPKLADRAKLQELTDVLQIKHVFVFNDQGVMTGTNSSYTNFILSEDPEDQSYEFRKLLQGVEYLVQEPMPEEVSGRVRRASSPISSRACSSSSRASSAWATSSR